MAWTKKILKVLGENKKKDGTLFSKWEIVQNCKDDSDQKMKPELHKTGFYIKDGALVRGFPQGLTTYDLNWIREHWNEIRQWLDPAPGTATPEAETAKEATVVEEGIEEVPF